MGASRSYRYLTVFLPSDPKEHIIYETAGGERWPGPTGTPPATLTAIELWRSINRKKRSQEALVRAGQELAGWLFDRRAAAHLVDVSAGDRRARIEIVLPHLPHDVRPKPPGPHGPDEAGPSDWADWPWELACINGLFLATDGRYTIVRMLGRPGARGDDRAPTDPAPAVPVPPVRVQAIGVTLGPGSKLEPLGTAQEVERIARVLRGVKSGRRNLFDVAPDLQGLWDTLREHVERNGPPHVLHFAGHGFAGGLVFSKPDGTEEAIDAPRIANLLTARHHERPIHLVYLNACYAGASRSKALPSGGPALLLLQGGVPAIVTQSVPVLDDEADPLAVAFYRALANGCTIDCAVQTARQELYLREPASLGWAFLTCSVAGAPRPLCAEARANGARSEGPNAIAIGHDRQIGSLSRLSHQDGPLVVVVWGEEGRGHRNLLARYKTDLESKGQALWIPVAQLGWFRPSIPEVSRRQLAAALAFALELPSDGPSEAIEQRIAGAIAQKSYEAPQRLRIIELQEVVRPFTRNQAEALVTLVRDLFSELMRLAALQLGHAPCVMLLLPIAWPAAPQESDRSPRAEATRELIQWTRQAVRSMGSAGGGGANDDERAASGKIAGKYLLRGEGRVLVQVLDELEAWDEDVLADFLVENFRLDNATARREAQSMLDDPSMPDGRRTNEGILHMLRQYWHEFEQQGR